MMKEKINPFLMVVGTLIVFYAIFVMGFVAASPDLRFRTLLTEKESSFNRHADSVLVHVLEDLECEEPRIQSGDRLLKLGDHEIHSFLDVMREISKLNGATLPPGGYLDEGGRPGQQDPQSLPWLVEDSNGDRWIKTRYLSQDHSNTEQTTWLKVNTVPFWQHALLFAWFLLALLIFAVGSLAYWHRPFDRAIRLFFAMCLVTLGAFIGGYHWWIISQSAFLSIPFALCAIFLPTVTLHFFLSYPRPRFILKSIPKTSLYLMYIPPVVASLGILGYLGWAGWYLTADVSAAVTSTALAKQMLWIVSQGIRVYLGIAAFYFSLTLVTLIVRYTTNNNPIERNQVKWILWAGMFATIPVSYALYLAQFDRIGFVLGKARIPMILASISFLIAYAVAIVRYKLILMDQIINRGVSYYLSSLGTTLLLGFLIVLGGLLGHLLDIKLSLLQLTAVGAISLLAVVLLVSFRDIIQQAIDQRFFREKYQLDRALQRMNQAVDHLIEPEALASLMLSSCCDILLVERAAFFVQSTTDSAFQLIAIEGSKQDAMPISFPSDTALLAELVSGTSLQRVTLDSREKMSPVQGLLRLLNARLIHLLTIDGNRNAVIVLGEKAGNLPFTAEDITFLNALCQITNVALHSATVHQNMSQLNNELSIKSEKVTDLQRQIRLLQAEIVSQQDPSTDSETEPTLDVFHAETIRGNSLAMKSVLEMVRKVSSTQSTVMIRGESGTGKELLARVIHENSTRRDGPLITVHCAALSPSLLESELFGHVKGAFTGAHRDKIGRFEAADGGTLFLDEIGDVPQETQIKLLRVLQERSFEPVGGTHTIHVNVRLITATNRNLEKLIEEGKFREDFFYRLNVVNILLPQLRERTEDILELALYFLKKYAEQNEKYITHIAGEALSALEQYHWPGNIRELENVIERAVVLADSNSVTLQDLPDELFRIDALTKVRNRDDQTFLKKKSTTGIQPAISSFNTPQAQSAFPKISPDMEIEELKAALIRCNGNKTQAAKLLNLPRSTYYSKLKKHGISFEVERTSFE